MKKLFTAAMFSFLAFGALAETGSVTFTYASDQGEDLGMYGKGLRDKRYDVAIGLNEPALVGKKITGIRAYLSTADGVIDGSVWLTSELAIDKDNGDNIVDILSIPTPVEDAQYAGYTGFGLLRGQLSDPYTITEDPVYIGYSFKMEDVTTDYQKLPLLLSEGFNAQGLYLHIESSVLKWSEYSSRIGGVAVLLVDIEGEFEPYSLTVTEMEETVAPKGVEFTVPLTVSNSGLNMVNELTYSYTVSGNTTETTYQLPTPIEARFGAYTSINLPINPIEGLGAYDLSLTVTKVNGNDNTADNKTVSNIVYVAEKLPVHRPLVEEITSLGCGWCTRGFIGMELINEHFDGEANTACYHYNYNGVTDPMKSSNYYPASPSPEGYYFPAATIDRKGWGDPYDGNYEGIVDFGISIDIEEAMAIPAIADIDLTAEIDGNILKVDTDVTFVKNVTDSPYLIGYLVTCNGLHNEKWGQLNYFDNYKNNQSWLNAYKGTALEQLFYWGSPVYDLVFNDVVVYANDMFGRVGSLDSTIELNKTYTNHYEVNYGNIELVTDPEYLAVIAFVVNTTTEEVINSRKYYINKDKANSGVENVEIDSTVVETQYYDINGRRVNNPNKGIFIKVEKLENGKTRTSKVALR